MMSFFFSLQVEGTFRVNTPPVLLGYHKRGRHSGAPSGLGIISRNDTLLTLFVTIEPPLQPSQPMAERVTFIVFCLIFKGSQTVMSLSCLLALGFPLRRRLRWLQRVIILWLCTRKCYVLIAVIAFAFTPSPLKLITC